MQRHHRRRHFVAWLVLLPLLLAALVASVRLRPDFDAAPSVERDGSR